ncbi:MAG TPA: hypothetical protein PLQ67_01150 [Burkholderiaceae bacterium]|nr:hypothetical protein [Burkholderiaceae bacterium]
MQANELNTTALSTLAHEAQAQQTQQGNDNLVELSSLELAMVGGGSGAVSFY